MQNAFPFEVNTPTMKVLLHDRRERPSEFLHQYTTVTNEEMAFIGVSVKRMDRIEDCYNKFPMKIHGMTLTDPW